ncbi:unnamed protein product [Cuscuta epithymum]|uniref:Uncharacterized protein n=1 Tax=Cuscuta epithymum TaxID=186058 RepID=A0AAV0F9V2_9ASTE|nr:unnamed protein product [Cuscuta epithymum]
MMTALNLHHIQSLFFFLSFLPLIAFSLRHFPSQPVLGSDGKELKLGKPYYVFSTLFPKAHGLCLVDNADCPDDVIECPSFYTNLIGLPITISPLSPSEDTIVREDTPYHISFPSAISQNCSDENLWYIKEDEIPNKEFVAIGPESQAEEFKIQKVLGGYKISYCVLIPIPPTPVCYGIGLIPQNGYNRLGIGLGVNLTQFYFTNNVTHVHNHHQAPALPEVVNNKLPSNHQVS